MVAHAGNSTNVDIYTKAYFHNLHKKRKMISERKRRERMREIEKKRKEANPNAEIETEPHVF